MAAELSSFMTHFGGNLNFCNHCKHKLPCVCIGKSFKGNVPGRMTCTVIEFHNFPHTFDRKEIFLKVGMLYEYCNGCARNKEGHLCNHFCVGTMAINSKKEVEWPWFGAYGHEKRPPSVTQPESQF